MRELSPKGPSVLAVGFNLHLLILRAKAGVGFTLGPGKRHTFLPFFSSSPRPATPNLISRSRANPAARAPGRQARRSRPTWPRSPRGSSQSRCPQSNDVVSLFFSSFCFPYFFFSFIFFLFFLYFLFTYLFAASDQTGLSKSAARRV